jgi:hypothetical protein
MADHAEPVTATFRVYGAFVLHPRALFIVRGIVITGTVGIGQRVVLPDGIDAFVTGVEARLGNVGGGASQTALTFRYSTPAQLARWKSLAIEGVELSLSGTPEPPSGPGKRR